MVRYTGKIFGIGFHKTGTTSLGTALHDLGYSVCGLRKGALSYILRGDLEPVFGLVERYDAFEDNPWPLLYRELDQRFAGSKFILTVRERNDWLASAVNHFGTRETEMRQWIRDRKH